MNNMQTVSLAEAKQSILALGAEVLHVNDEESRLLGNERYFPGQGRGIDGRHGSVSSRGARSWTPDPPLKIGDSLCNLIPPFA